MAPDEVFTCGKGFCAYYERTIRTLTGALSNNHSSQSMGSQDVARPPINYPCSSRWLRSDCSTFKNREDPGRYLMADADYPSDTFVIAGLYRVDRVDNVIDVNDGVEKLTLEFRHTLFPSNSAF